jgi:hypothetical protein
MTSILPVSENRYFPSDGHTIAVRDLPQDLECLIFQLTSDYDSEVEVPDCFPLGVIQVSGIPAIPLDESDRGTAYATEMDLRNTPPVLIAHGQFFDGKHRRYNADRLGVSELLAIDLTEWVPMKAVSGNGMGPVSGYTPLPDTANAPGHP